MLLGRGVESGCASRFSLSGSLRMVTRGVELDWLTEGSEGALGLRGESGCASRFSLSGSLRMEMCRGERGRLTDEGKGEYVF